MKNVAYISNLLDEPRAFRYGGEGFTLAPGRHVAAEVFAGSHYCTTDENGAPRSAQRAQELSLVVAHHALTVFGPRSGFGSPDPTVTLTWDTEEDDSPAPGVPIAAPPVAPAPVVVDEQPKEPAAEPPAELPPAVEPPKPAKAKGGKKK